MKLIKKLTQGNRTLQHHQYVNDFGFVQDCFEIIEMDEKGFMTLLPFIGPAKVNVYDRSQPIGIGQTYTDEEYQTMLQLK